MKISCSSYILKHNPTGLFDGCLIGNLSMNPFSRESTPNTTICCGLARMIPKILFDGYLTASKAIEHVDLKSIHKPFMRTAFVSHFRRFMRHRPICCSYVRHKSPCSPLPQPVDPNPVIRHVLKTCRSNRHIPKFIRMNSCPFAVQNHD